MNYICVGIFHKTKGRMKYPFKKAMNPISRQAYIMNLFLFLCRVTFALVILMYNFKDYTKKTDIS